MTIVKRVQGTPRRTASKNTQPANVVKLSDYRKPLPKRKKGEFCIRAISAPVSKPQAALHVGRHADRRLYRRLRNGRGVWYRVFENM